MRKLVQGIVEFRKNVRDGYRENFAKLALGQSPDTLFIACSDSRVVPNTFASTNPGDLFVLRNVGNLIAPCGPDGISSGDESEAAAVEFSILNLNVESIVICGHSECGAIQAILNGRDKVAPKNLKSWLRHGETALDMLKTQNNLDPKLSPANKLSQLNVLLQMEHVKTYPDVQKRIDEGRLQIHGWWFDIKHADVYYFDNEKNKFFLIDEKSAEKLLQKFIK